jgi:phosphoserine phosphatase
VFKADDYCSTILEIKGDSYTGNLDGDINQGSKKLRKMQSIIRENGVRKEDIAVLTDHFTDLELLEACGNPVAVNPDRKLERFSKEKGWKIINL